MYVHVNEYSKKNLEKSIEAKVKQQNMENIMDTVKSIEYKKNNERNGRWLGTSFTWVKKLA